MNHVAAVALSSLGVLTRAQPCSKILSLFTVRLAAAKSPLAREKLTASRSISFLKVSGQLVAVSPIFIELFGQLDSFWIF